jgi:hypothetical protein
MAFILDDYLDDYIQHANEFDKKVALHLKEIIPKTAYPKPLTWPKRSSKRSLKS